MKMHVGAPLQPAIVLGLVRVEVIEDDMDLEAPIEIDQLVHEVEKFAPPASPVVPGGDYRNMY